MEKIKRIDIFPHSGSKVPLELQERLISGLKPEQLVETVEINRDSGLEFVLEMISPDPQRLVVTFDYARVLMDVNRLELEKQMPSVPYRGTQLVEFDVDLRRELAEKYILPWQWNVVRLVQENPATVVVHWHTMDECSWGNANLHQEVRHGEQRPIGQVLSRVDTDYASLRNYFPNATGEILQSHLIAKEAIPKVVQIFADNLGPIIKNIPTGKNFQPDNPYKLFGESKDSKPITAGLLTSLISMVNGNLENKQLIFEVRKDLFAEYGSDLAKRVCAAVDEVVDMWQ